MRRPIHAGAPKPDRLWASRLTSGIRGVFLHPLPASNDECVSSRVRTRVLESFRDTFFMSMLNKSAVFVVGAVMVGYLQCGFAAGFGRSSHSTTLGQVLEMVVPITADSTEQLTNDCLSAEVMVGDTRLNTSAVRSRLEWLGESGVRVLRVSTSVRIDEPVVTVTVAAGCPPRLTRQFVLFIDPPAAAVDPVIAAPLVSSESGVVSSGSGLVSPESGLVAPVRASSPVPESLAGMFSPAAADPKSPAARPSAVQSVDSARPRRARPTAAVARATSVEGATVSGRKPSGAKPAQTVKHARLQLEPDARPLPAVPTAASVAELMASAASAAEAAASESEAVAQRQREALQSLQKQMEAIKAQTETANKSIAQMQSNLRESRESSSGWLLLASALAAAVVALLALVVWLLRQRAAAAKAGTWWSAESQRAPLDAGQRTSNANAASRRSDFGGSFQDSSQWASDSALPDMTEGVLTDFQGTGSFADEPQPRGGLGAAVAAQGGPTEQDSAPFLTADELIDLDQQSEFFVALGQDESAIGLLESQLARAGGGGPWPYLKLLEIYRRQADRGAFDHVRERFVDRFGVAPADWHDVSFAGKSLDAYSGVVQRIESVWAEPEEAMRLLETLMVRGDADSGVFDLAAIGDMESLYLLAKSLLVPAQHDADSVDLFLPLELDPGAPRGAPTQQPAQAEDSTIDFTLDLLPADDDPRARN